MKIVATVEEMRSVRAELKGSVGLVPTMGALHPGHEALLEAAVRDCDSVIATLFVNPKQFDDSGDYEKYPRDLDRDMDIFEKRGVACTFAPNAEAMYGIGDTFSVSPGRIGEVLEGKYRQGCFTGVSTVVTKFFSSIRPHVGYFGEKDAQQLAVVRQLNKELMFGIEIVAVETVREPSGLAWSSRNSQLNPEEKRAAASIYAGLSAAADAWKEGERNSAQLCGVARKVLEREPAVSLEYIAFAEPDTFEELQEVRQGSLMLTAAYVGGVRLIDNIAMKRT